MTTRTVHRVCTLCEATCGLSIEAEDSRVLRIRGDADDPFSRGHLCAKAQALADVHHDPDRLRRPLRRTATGFEEIGWEEAFDLAAGGLARVREAGGADAVALYRGNPVIHDLASTLYYNALQQVVGTRNQFSAASLDTWPRYVQVASMFGGMLHIPVPDLDRTQHLLVLGANPIVSNGSLMTAPDVRGRLKALRARGGRLVVVDPRRSETAELADEHHFIRPGADTAFLLAMLHTLFDEDRVDPGRLAAFSTGLDAVRAAVARYRPEAVAERCGIAAETIRRLAREFAAAERAVAYGRMGTCCQRFGTLACWAIELLNFVTGNLDRPGGAMFPRAAANLDFAFSQGGGGVRFGRHRSRVSGYDEIFGELPVAALIEEIETPGPGRIRGLVSFAGNPVISAPDSARLDAALAGLDFMVSIDFYLNETTRHAHVILPPTHALEHGTYDLGLYNLAIRNVAKWSPPVFEPEPGSRTAWVIVLELAKRLLALPALPNEQVDDIVLSRLVDRALPASRFAGALDAPGVVATLGKTPGPERILDLLLRLGPYGDGFGLEPEGLGLERVRMSPHGLDLGALEPALPGRLTTASGRIELAPERILADLPRLDAWLAEDARAGAGELSLIGRRDARSMNSWLHNAPALARGRERCTLQLHPLDARSLSLAAGDAARVSSAAGDLVVTVELSDRLMPGVASLPHGWGHDLAGARLRVAAARPGVNTNRLLAAAAVDAPSGASMLNGIAVRVEPVDAARP